jgi:hypothetical protein
MAPSFFILGAQKAGTSSLWNYLLTHPKVVSPVRKELAFFNTDCHQAFCLSESGNKDQGEEYEERCEPSEGLLHEYLEKGRFPRRRNDIALDSITGEASASYLSCSCCPSVVHSLFPSAKLIVVLRRPEERAESRFHEQSAMTYRYWTDSYHDFQHYITVSPTDIGLSGTQSRLQRISDCLGAAVELGQKVACATDDNVIGWSLYEIFIQNWQQYFPPESFLFIRNEDLRNDPAGVMSKVEQHLGLPPHNYSADGFVKYNTRGCLGWHSHPSAKNCDSHVHTLRDAADMAGTTLLKQFYDPYTLALQVTTGLDLRTWGGESSSSIAVGTGNNGSWSKEEVAVGTSARAEEVAVGTSARAEPSRLAEPSTCSDQAIFTERQFQKDLSFFDHRKYEQHDLDQMVTDLVTLRRDLVSQITVVQIINNTIYCVPVDGATHRSVRAAYSGFFLTALPLIFRFNSSCFPENVALNRNFWLLQLLNKTALEHGIPDLQFIFGTNDFPFVRKSEWSKNVSSVPIVFAAIKSDKEYDIVAPSHIFIDPAFGTSWSHWHGSSVQESLDSKYPWLAKVSKAVWRGRAQISMEHTSAYDYRRWLWEKTQSQSDMYDVGITDGEVSAIAEAGISLAPRMPMLDHAKFKYLLQLDGVTASSRYMKLLLLNSVVFKQKSIWYEFFESALVPHVHYIPFEFTVDPDKILSHQNLTAQIEWAREHDDTAREVGVNGREFARRHLSLQAATCAWKNLLNEYAVLLKGGITKHSKAESYTDLISTIKSGPSSALTRFTRQLD